MVSSGPGTSGTRHIKRKWPHVSGLTAGTTKQEGRKPNLKPEGINKVKSTVPKKDKVGID